MVRAVGVMTAPWLSVVIPVFNGGRTLGRTLASLPSGATGIEVILVDQSSTDGSLAIAAEHRERLDLRIIPVVGTTSWMQNTNIGIDAARAPLIGMLHQDDLWSPGRAETLRAFIERHPQARLWVHDSWFIDLQDRPLARYAPPFARREALIPSREALRRLLVQNTLTVPSVIFRRSDVLSTGGLDEELWYTADWDLWLRLAHLGDVAYLPEPLVAFRLHAGSLTLTGSRDAAEFQRQLEIPLDRYIGALLDPDRGRVRQMAEASNLLNLCLAAGYHRQASDWLYLLGRLMRLGPLGFGSMLHDTRVLARALPRLRLMAGSGKEPA